MQGRVNDILGEMTILFVKKKAKIKIKFWQQKRSLCLHSSSSTLTLSSIIVKYGIVTLTSCFNSRLSVLSFISLSALSTSLFLDTNTLGDTGKKKGNSPNCSFLGVIIWLLDPLSKFEQLVK